MERKTAHDSDQEVLALFDAYGILGAGLRGCGVRVYPNTLAVPVTLDVALVTSAVAV